jgi:hypothetical protein
VFKPASERRIEMAKLRNVSPDTLSVPLLGVTVEPDQVLEVPDGVYEQYAWPESLWAVVAAAKPSKSAATAEEV